MKRRQFMKGGVLGIAAAGGCYTRVDDSDSEFAAGPGSDDGRVVEASDLLVISTGEIEVIHRGVDLDKHDGIEWETDGQLLIESGGTLTLQNANE